MKTKGVKKMNGKVGEIAFNIGVLIALAMGILSNWVDTNPSIAAILAGILVTMGLIVGFMNVTGAETKDFLLFSAVLIIGATGASSLSAVPMIGGYIVQTFNYLLIFIVPQTLVVCLKAIHGLSKN